MQTIEKLEIKQMSRAFGKNVVLQDFSLEIPGGKFISLLGPSGCGKTTALNCLAGLLDPTSGEILLNGNPIQDIPPERRGFGMVFQNYALFPHLTVKRNVQYGLESRPMPRSEREKRVRWALDLVQLNSDEFGDRFPAQLSGGQQQRLAFARTIVLEPSLLLLDEPLSNLDAKLRNEMRVEIKRIHMQLALTTIYVTHDQAEAMSLSDLVVVMRKGRIEQIGTPQEIYECPRSAYVADFMGYANRVPATIKGREERYWIVETEGGVTLRASSTFDGAANWKYGDAVTAYSRPDDMTPDTTVNQITGTASLLDYVGKTFQTVVRLGDDHALQVLIYSSTAAALDSPITFGIVPERLLLFPREAVVYA